MGSVVVARRWREQRAHDLQALQDQLDRRAVDAGDDREAGTRRVGSEDGDVEADDHVDIVTGLDDRADAADLVDLHRHAALRRRALDVEDLALRPPLNVVAVIAAPATTGWRTILPMTCETSPNASASRASTDLTSVVTWSARMAVPNGMSWVAMTVGSSVGTAAVAGGSPGPLEQQDADEGDDRQEHPDEQDQSIRALQSWVSPSRDV